MRVACPSCKTQYNIDDSRIPSGGARLKCAKCQTMFPLKPQGDQNEAIPLPGSRQSSSSSANNRALDETATISTATAIPRDAHTTPDAVPLPGPGFTGLTAAQPQSQDDAYWDRKETRIVPGGSAHISETSDTLFDEPDESEEVTAYDDVPPPPPPEETQGFGFEESAAIPLPGSGLFAPPPPPPDESSFASLDSELFGSSEEAVPLPQPLPLQDPFDDPPRTGMSLADEGHGLFNLDQQGGESGVSLDPRTSSGAIPLPGRGLFSPPPPPETLHHTPETEFDKFDSFPPAPPPSNQAFDARQFEEVEFDTESTRVAELSMPGEAFPPALEDEPRTLVRDGPIPSAAYKPFPPAPPSRNVDPPLFDDLPSPASSNVSFDDLDSGPEPERPLPQEPDFEFADADLLPSPAAPAIADRFDGLPSPAQPRSPLEDFDPLPSPASARNPVTDFGDVDFAEPGAPDPLEFDPSGAPPPPPDALEADLSAPLPTPKNLVGPDGLEMLDFIDSAAQAAGPGGQQFRGRRFHVRRRNGKVFGPFDEPTILAMLEENQLQGNEDVSTDADAWTAIGTVPAFSSALQRILSSPKTQSTRAASAAPAIDGLKQKYESRMAARTTTPSERGTALQFLQHHLLLVIGGALGAIFLIVGLSLGTTRYGVFANKKLFPATIRRGSPEARELDTARAGILADNFLSYKEARDRAARLLNKREYPEARAVWDQAVFSLQRRYAASSPAELKLASGSLQDVLLLGEKELEVIKAQAGDALTQRNPDAALALLQPLAAGSDATDPEFLFLLAEAYTQKDQVKSAQDALKKALGHKADAKAHHALGDLQQKAGNADGAVKEYEAALTADARHAQSAVELAAVELLLRKHEERGLDALDRALDEKNQPQLGPAQRARAHALRGYALGLQFKPTEALAELEQAQKLDASSSFTRLALARTFLAQRNYDKSLPLFQALQKAEPDNIDATEGYLTALISMGKMTDALNVLNEATRRFPGNARLALLTGQVEDALDHGRDAEQAYLRALNADPKLYEAHLALAHFYLRFRRTEDARKQLLAAVADAPKDAAVHATMGELDVQDGELDKAQTEFEQTIALNPHLPEGTLGLARVALERRDFPTARKHAQAALASDPHIKGGHLLLGTVLWRQGDLPGAAAELQKGKDEDPGAAPVAIQLAAVKLEQGDIEGAENGILGVLAGHSTEPDALFVLGRVKNKKGEHAAAIEAMRNALDRAPTRAAFQYEMGVILRDASKSNEALESWAKAVKLDPGMTDAWEAMGVVNLERNKPEDAIVALTAGLKADPTRARLRSELGDCYYLLTQWSLAISNYQAALKQDPKLTTVFFKIGRSYTELGRHTEAINWYQRAVQADGGNPMPYYYLGYAFKERGRKRDAIVAFKAYLARKPNAEDKKDISDEVYDLEQLR